MPPATYASTPREARRLLTALEAGDEFTVDGQHYTVERVEINEYETPTVTAWTERGARRVKTAFRPSSGAQGSAVVTVGAGTNDYFGVVRRLSGTHG